LTLNYRDAKVPVLLVRVQPGEPLFASFSVYAGLELFERLGPVGSEKPDVE